MMQFVTFKDERESFRVDEFRTKLFWVDHAEIKDDLMSLEKKLFFTQYKFGILYAKAHNMAEDLLYENSEMSPDFEEFLEWVGDKVQLSGWKKFKGGLDVRGTNCTGTHSYYTSFKGQEIMFHVGPMMPIKDNDPSRKRYIGNDVVVIIFKESDTDDKFDPHLMRSQYNHIFAVVEKVKTSSGPSYKVEISQKPSVPPYPPFFTNPPLLPMHEDARYESRDFFLTKLINAERSTISSVPIFRANMTTTREALIADVVKNYLKKEKKKPAQPIKKLSEDDAKEKPNWSEDSIYYDQLEEAVMAYLCREKNIPFENLKQAVEQLSEIYLEH